MVDLEQELADLDKEINEKVVEADTTPVEPPVTQEDIKAIIVLCLRHRLRKDPLESIDSGDKVIKVFNDIFEFVDES